MSGNVSNHVWVEDATKPLGGYWVREKGTADGATLVSLATTLAGEDQINHVLVTQQGGFQCWYNNQVGWTDVAAPINAGLDYIHRISFSDDNGGTVGTHVLTAALIIKDGGGGGLTVCSFAVGAVVPMVIELNIKSHASGGLALRTTSANDYVSIIGRSL